MVVSERQCPGAGEAVQVAAAVRALDGQPTCPHRHDGQGARVRPRRRLARRLPSQDPLVRGADPRRVGRIPAHRFGHGHGSLSSRCPGASRSFASSPDPTYEAPRASTRNSGQLGTGGRSRAADPHGYQPWTVHRVTGCFKIVAETKPSVGGTAPSPATTSDSRCGLAVQSPAPSDPLKSPLTIDTLRLGASVHADASTLGTGSQLAPAHRAAPPQTSP